MFKAKNCSSLTSLRVCKKLGQPLTVQHAAGKPRGPVRCAGAPRCVDKAFVFARQWVGDSLDSHNLFYEGPTHLFQDDLYC